jgi:hypothetical protein
MYAGTGISTDSARRKKSKSWARWTARQCKRLFEAKPMPELQSPAWQTAAAAAGSFSGIDFPRAAAPFVVLRGKE